MDALYPYPPCTSPHTGEFSKHDFHRALVVSMWHTIKVWFCPYCLYVVNEDGTIRQQTSLVNDEVGEYLVFPSSLEHLLPKAYQLPPFSDSNEFSFGDYAVGRYAWILTDVKALKEPIPCKGALSLWDVPEHVESLIREQLQ